MQGPRSLISGWVSVRECAGLDRIPILVLKGSPGEKSARCLRLRPGCASVCIMNT